MFQHFFTISVLISFPDCSRHTDTALTGSACSILFAHLVKIRSRRQFLAQRRRVFHYTEEPCAPAHGETEAVTDTLTARIHTQGKSRNLCQQRSRLDIGKGSYPESGWALKLVLELKCTACQNSQSSWTTLGHESWFLGLSCAGPAAGIWWFLWVPSGSGFFMILSVFDQYHT